MPPALVRRAVLAPLWIALSLATGALSPLLLAAGAAVSALKRDEQPTRLVHFVLLYLQREAAALLGCGGLWLLTGCGRRIDARWSQKAHYRLLGWMLDGILQPVLKSLRIEVSREFAPDAEAALRDLQRPLILLSRHAGPGDSFLVLTTLLRNFERQPRIVMKQTLALDPGVDVLCHRLPNALIDPADRAACEQQISGLARTLGNADVLVLFPEGGNYTPERRHKAILSLRRRGRRAQAQRAERMPHVMPPQPAGALAAFAANSDADVLFAAHTGLGHEAFPLELWRKPPSDRTVKMRIWLAPAGERPATPDEQTDWLFSWWKQLDEWIERAGTEPL